MGMTGSSISTLTRRNTDMAEVTVFSEDLHSDSGDESDEDTRDTDYITVANATTDSIKVVIKDLTLVTQTNMREKSLAVGADLVGGANIQAGLGGADLQQVQSGRQTHDVGHHSMWKVPVDPSAKQGKGKAVNLKNSLQVNLYKKGGAELTKLGSYVVGPGHGLIISSFEGKYQVEQARGRSWRRRFDPWLTNLKTSRDPHLLLPRRKRCQDCGHGRR